MMAILCSDPRANSLVPEAQAITRIVEAYQWTAQNHEQFADFLVGPHDQLKRLYSGWLSELLGVAAHQIPNNGLLVLKHPAMVRVLGPLMELAPSVQPVVMVRDPRDQVASEQAVAARAGRPNSDAAALAKNLRSWFDGLDTSGLTIVRYEDLVSDYVNVKKHLETNLDLQLSFEPSASWPNLDGLSRMLAYPSWSSKYGQAIDTGSVGRYTADLGTVEIAAIEDICASYMMRFGYARSGK